MAQLTTARLILMTDENVLWLSPEQGSEVIRDFGMKHERGRIKLRRVCPIRQYERHDVRTLNGSYRMCTIGGLSHPLQFRVRVNSLLTPTRSWTW